MMFISCCMALVQYVVKVSLAKIGWVEVTATCAHYALSECPQVLAVSLYVPASCSTMGSVCLLQQSTNSLGNAL